MITRRPLHRSHVWMVPAVLAAAAVVLGIGVGTAQGAEEGLIQGDRWWNAVVAVVLFIILVAILGRYAWRPVLRAMQAREQALADIVAETERRKAEGEQMLNEYRARLQAAEEDVGVLLERAKEEAEATRNQLVEHAKRQAAAAIAEAERQILAAKQEAIKEIYRNTAGMATDMASKIVHREIGPADHDRLVDEGLRKIGETGDDDQ